MAALGGRLSRVTIRHNVVSILCYMWWLSVLFRVPNIDHFPENLKTSIDRKPAAPFINSNRRFSSVAIVYVSQIIPHRICLMDVHMDPIEWGASLIQINTFNPTWRGLFLESYCGGGGEGDIMAHIKSTKRFLAKNIDFWEGQYFPQPFNEIMPATCKTWIHSSPPFHEMFLACFPVFFF